VERAVVELDTLLSAQWRNGMIPQSSSPTASTATSLDPPVGDLGPGSQRAAPTAHVGDHPATVHAIAVQRILDHAVAGRSTRAVAESFLDRRLVGSGAVDRWLATARDPSPRAGSRCTTVESGMDNSPRWTSYANVIPGTVPEYQTRGQRDRTDASQRPSDVEYDRYLWLLER